MGIKSRSLAWAATALLTIVLWLAILVQALQSSLTYTAQVVLAAVLYLVNRWYLYHQNPVKELTQNISPLRVEPFTVDLSVKTERCLSHIADRWISSSMISRLVIRDEIMAWVTQTSIINALFILILFVFNSSLIVSGSKWVYTSQQVSPFYISISLSPVQSSGYLQF